jgi:hypothetical protein
MSKKDCCKTLFWAWGDVRPDGSVANSLQSWQPSVIAENKHSREIISV